MYFATGAKANFFSRRIMQKGICMECSGVWTLIKELTIIQSNLICVQCAFITRDSLATAQRAAGFFGALLWKEILLMEVGSQSPEWWVSS